MLVKVENRTKLEVGYTLFCLYILGRTLLLPRDREGIANLNSRVDQIKLLFSLGNETRARGSTAVELCTLRASKPHIV